MNLEEILSQFEVLAQRSTELREKGFSYNIEVRFEYFVQIVTALKEMHIRLEKLERRDS